MAEAFNPDQYLAQKSAPPASPAQLPFDPNKYLQEKASPGPSWLDTQLPFNTSPRGLIQGSLDSLPAAGMLAGGFAGGAAGVGAASIPLGVGGAALGAAGGESLKNLGEQYLLGKNKTRAEIYGNPVKGLVEGAENEMGGQAMGAGLKMASESKLGKKALEKIGSAASTVSSALSGVPKDEIEMYAKNTDEINHLARSSDYDSQEMADNLRQKFNDSIQARKAELNGQISEALKSKGGTVDPSPIINALEKSKSSINTTLRPEEVKEVDGLISKVKDLGKEGSLSLQNAHDVKEYLQDVAKGSYAKGGQIFTVGDKASRAAKDGARVARELVNKAAPEIAQANNGLSELHGIEDVMNKNMLSEGKTAASLMAAGSGGNPANAKTLKQLGTATGTDMLGDAQKMATARTFGKPSLLPVDTTGKSLTRMGVSGVAGYLAGGIPGAVAMEGLSSPAAIKAGINTGRGLIPVAGNPQIQGLLLRNALKQKGLLSPQQGLVNER